ncbi:hypothetical protein WJX81_006823 [Elliptochloris bilobata]|uniref:Uncharacterized protein n=1 Tax=Elliptochloris bilobata TaxID=381761 RepID=A0AAW1SCK1_9CHLO
MADIHALPQDRNRPYDDLPPEPKNIFGNIACEGFICAARLHRWQGLELLMKRGCAVSAYEMAIVRAEPFKRAAKLLGGQGADEVAALRG